MDTAPFLQAESANASRHKKALTISGTALASLGLVAFLSTQQNLQEARTQPQAPSALAADSGRVQVKLYGMAGCPYTRGFIEGPLAETLTTLGDHVDFEFFPFGNSYWSTEACGGAGETLPYASFFRGYNATVRECWDARCGSAAVTPASDCFAGQLLCQHGETDGLITKAWACAKDIASNDAAGYMPFIWCSARRYLAVTSPDALRETLSSCADASPAIDKAEILSCAASDRGMQLYQSAARSTPAHAGVPYALVEGRVVEDTGCVACGDGIIARVCQALRTKGGPETSVCAGIFGEI